MFGIGMPELILIFIVALLIFGPKRLPELGRSIGRAFAEFKKATEDIKESFETETRRLEEDIRKPFEEVTEAVTSTAKVALGEPESTKEEAGKKGPGG